MDACTKRLVVATIAPVQVLITTTTSVHHTVIPKIKSIRSQPPPAQRGTERTVILPNVTPERHVMSITLPVK